MDILWISIFMQRVETVEMQGGFLTYFLRHTSLTYFSRHTYNSPPRLPLGVKNVNIQKNPLKDQGRF